ncbi:MAG: aminotransferase, partial [Chloroflexota bacterium]
LAWLDCRAANLPASPHAFFVEHARVALNDGTDFGPEGAGFARLNFGCCRDLLREALERIRAALASRP